MPIGIGVKKGALKRSSSVSRGGGAPTTAAAARVRRSTRLSTKASVNYFAAASSLDRLRRGRARPAAKKRPSSTETGQSELVVVLERVSCELNRPKLPPLQLVSFGGGGCESQRVASEKPPPPLPWLSFGATGRRAGLADMPDHIVVSLLRQLNVRERMRAEGVCRRWRRLARDAAWADVRAFDYGALVADGSLSSAPLLDDDDERQRATLRQLTGVVERAAPHLLELNLSGFRACVNYSFVSRVCSLCAELTSLDLTGVQLTNSVVRTMGAQLGGRLRSLHMQGCFDTTNFERGLGSLFDDCANLQRLSIAENKCVTGAASFPLLPAGLNWLNVSGCSRLTDAALHYVAACCGQLEELRMDGLESVSAAAVQTYLGRLSSLRRLHFAEYFNTPIGAGAIDFTSVGRLANLQRLYLCDNFFVTDQTLLALAEGCKQLDTLDLSCCSRLITDAGIAALSRLPLLARLDLSQLKLISDLPLIAIADVGVLQVLFVHGCHFISDVGLKRVAQRCQGLRRLDASWCPLVSNATLQEAVALLDRRASDDSLELWLAHTAATQPAVAQHANLNVDFADHCGDCRMKLLFNE